VLGLARQAGPKIAASLALLLGCGPGAAGGDDAGARLSVRIEGPAHAFVGEEACFAARFAPPGEARWTLGGGDVEEGAEICRVFEVVGPRVLGVTVLRGAMRAEATHAVTVVFRPSEPRPTRASPIHVSDTRGWVVSPDADRIAIFSTDPPALEREVEVGARPRSLAVSDDVLAVACQGDATVHLLSTDGAPRRVVALDRGSEPWSILADPRGGGFFVALRTGVIVALDLEGSERSRVEVGPEPRGMAMNAEGALIATRWRSTLEGAHVYTVDASDPGALALTGETLMPRQEGLDSDTDNSGVLGFLDALAPSPDGGRVVIPALKANVVTGRFRTGEDLTSQTTARAALGEVLIGAPDALARDSFRHSFDDLDRASAGVFSPLGDRLFLAMMGAQVVVVVDGFDFFSVASIDGVGEAPQGLALSPDGRTLYVHAFLSRSVRVYDVSSLSREPPLVGEIPTTATEPLAPEVLEGKRLFFRSRDPRMSRTSYLSCASCHLDGESDGLSWDFTQRGEGVRDTISLRGRAGAAPLHWSANFDEVQDFEHDIRSAQGGEGFLDDALLEADPLGAPKAGRSAELDALAAYVVSLSAHGESPETADAATVARGEAVFRAAGCDACHAGPDYTDSAFVDGAPILHDVGTLGPASGGRLGGPLPGLDTPSLRGLWRSAPYLHDGSAPTLRAVLLDRNPDDRHGVTSSLSEDALADLEAFLRAL